MGINKKESNIKKEKRKKGVKRQISIITVFLWVFLVTTMITITTSSIKNKNAIVEIDDENWNVTLVMYDRSSDTPNEEITESTFNANRWFDRKQLCIQVNYSCTTGKQYNPGELVIEVLGIGKDSFSEYYKNYDNYNSNESYYDNWLRNYVTIAADKISDTSKKYDWSYNYDKENNLYIFVNNNVIAENEHFEGTVQVVYNLEPNFKIKTDLEFKAEFKENITNTEELVAKESNICKFHYTSTKYEYKLGNTAVAGAKADYTQIEDILDDYYWVRYNWYTTKKDSNKGVINALTKDCGKIEYYELNNCIKTILPEGAVIYDEKLNKVEPMQNNTYYYLKSSSNSFYYVGYPKSKYNEGDSVTNIAEVWGRYEDEEEIQKLSEASSTVSLVAFDFEYKGKLYDIDKYSSSGDSKYLNLIKNGGEIKEWFLYATAFYTDSIMDVEIGDDLLYITRENGEVTKLEENEYNFTEVDIPVFYTYNKYSGSIGEALIGYDYEVQVRYKDTNEYVIYKEGITTDKKIGWHGHQDEIVFNREDIVGVKVVIKDLEKTLYQNIKNDGIRVYTNIHTKDCAKGNIYNFDYLQVYKKDEAGNRTLQNEVTEDSYKTPSTLKISEYDLNTYGKYIQREYISCDILDGYFSLRENKLNGNLINNVKEEKYEIEYTLKNRLSLYYYEVNKDVIIKQYDILPSGMNLVSSKEEIISSIYTTLPYRNLKLKDGTVFNTEKEFENYIKENTTIDIDYNYRECGRTKISIIYNLNDIDWSYFLTSIINGGAYDYGISIKLGVEIPYDSILEYGTRYENIVYAMWNNQEYGYEEGSSIIDNGRYDSLATDIDDDGDIEEKLGYSNNTLNITHAVSSQQAIIKQVRTDLTKGKFVEGTAETSAGSEYTYKLRVTTGANSLKDLILYDTLETTYNENGEEITEGWKGEFLNVDTSYAVSKGYAPKIYYSEEKNPGKLTEVPEKWRELTDDVDKSLVKSICVDLRCKADGSEMELSPNNVVFVLVNMQAPNDDTLLTSSHNMFSTNWRAIDPLGGVIDNIEGIYSNEVNVEIHKEDVRTEISGVKTWEDENNKYGVRPESITVKLLQDGQEYETKQVSADTNWEYTFENVPVYKSNTSAYEYEIIEEEILTYETTYDGYNITNSIKLKDLEVTKVWNDNNNEALKRPASVTLQVYDSDVLISEQEVNEESEWEHTFTNLLKYRDNGEEINYTVNEKSFTNDKFYVKEISGNTITNTFTVPEDKITIVGTKVWSDENNRAGKRPDNITLQVKENGVVVTEQVVNSSNNWSYEFELAKYDNLGNERTYTIDEKDTGNKFYRKELTNNTTVTNIFEVPNETINVEAIKVWNDRENEALKRPESIKLQVKAKGAIVEEFIVNDSNDWKHTFTLPKYDSLGEEIEYTVDEDFISEFYVKSIVGNTITNTLTVPADKVTIVGTKVWEDLNNFAGKRDEQITLQLIGDNEVIAEHVVSEDNNWSYSFEVPKYDKYGNEISYHIDERDTGNKFYKKELTDDNTVINIFEVPDEKKSIEVMKVWEDSNNESGKRPTSIKLQIKRNGTVVDEYEVNESTSWKHTFEVPKYDERGDEIVYTVDEDFVSEFYIKNIVGNVITNTFVVPEDRVKIVGTKVWEDSGNASGKRDNSIFLQLKNSKDEIVSEAEVSETNNWSYEFEVPKYDSLGNEVSYHIDERNTKNKFYEKELTDESTVTNKFVIPDEKVLVKAVKKWEDNNNSFGKRPSSVTLQIYNKDIVVAERKVSESNNWSFEVELPKYDELGDEIEYTVDEKGTSKFYEKSIEGNVVINRFMYDLPNTSDINVFMYMIVFVIAIIGVIVGIVFVSKNKTKQ